MATGTLLGNGFLFCKFHFAYVRYQRLQIQAIDITKGVIVRRF